MVPAKNILFSEARTKRAVQDLILELPSDMVKLGQQKDLSILAHGEGEPFNYDHMDGFNTAEGDRAIHPLHGYWSCVNLNDTGEIQGTFDYLLRVGADGTVSGTRESWAGLSKVSGTVQSSDGSPMDLQLDYILNDAHVYIKGRYDPATDVITGELEPEGENWAASLAEKGVQRDPDIPYVDGGDPQDVGQVGDKPEQNGGEMQAPSSPSSVDEDEQVKEEHIRLLMTRKPANVVQLRRYLDLENSAFPHPLPSPARRRWIFAIDATKQLLRAQCMSWSDIKGKFAERRLYVDLAMRESTGLITSDDQERLSQLTRDLPPSQTRLYESVTRFLLGRSYASKM